MITEIKWGFVVYITTLTCNKTWYTHCVPHFVWPVAILKCWKSD